MRLAQHRYLRRKLQQQPLAAADNGDDDDDVEEEERGETKKPAVSKPKSKNGKQESLGTTKNRQVYTVDHGWLAAGVGEITWTTGSCRPYLATISPDPMDESLLKVHRAIKALEKRFNIKRPAAADVARELGMTRDQVLAAMDALSNLPNIKVARVPVVRASARMHARTHAPVSFACCFGW